MKEILILGAGGNCLEVLDAIHVLNLGKKTKYRCLGILDDNPASHGRRLHGVEVLGPLERAHDFEGRLFVDTIGSEGSFWKKGAILETVGLPAEAYETIIHPAAVISGFSDIGPGSIVLQNVTISSNAVIGAHVLILANAVLSHDVRVGDYACLAGGVCIAGHARIGSSCYLGANSAIRGGVTIGDRCLIGMGAVVLNDVPDNQVMVGVPAKRLRETT